MSTDISKRIHPKQNDKNESCWLIKKHFLMSVLKARHLANT